MSETLFPEITTAKERRAAKRNPEPDFTFLSMGAGVQGTTIVLLVAEGRLPKPDYAIFADTGWEPSKVYDHLDKLERDVMQPISLPLLRVSDGNLREEVMDPRYTSRLPLYIRSVDGEKHGILDRRCTSFYKVAPIQRKVRELLGAKSAHLSCRKCAGTGQRVTPWLKRYADDHSIGVCSVCHGTGTILRVGPPPGGAWALNWIGFSVDEMQRCSDSRIGYTVSHYPLLEKHIRFSRDDCLTYLAEHGWPDTPKSACIGCPFHSDDAWRRVRANPVEWADAVEVDAAIRSLPGIDGRAYLHSDRVPLPLADIGVNGDEKDHQSCSPYGCRSGDPIEEPPPWDDIDQPEGSLWRVMAENDADAVNHPSR